ncbi:hypothetical protein Tco_0407800 [Tanacetum coccineum]
MASNEETNTAGTDTYPPMLVESDYKSWKIRIHRYIRGKPNGKLIWKSIQNRPTPHPMITDPPPTGSTIVPAPRKKLNSKFNEEENKLEMADTQAKIILNYSAQHSNSSDEHQFLLTNNQLWTSSNSKTHAMVHDGQIVTERVQRKASGNVGNTGARRKKYFKDKMLLIEAKEKGATLDTKAEAFLANVECTAPYDQPLVMTTTNIFEVNHEDAYDSNVDEGPNAAVAFMANLSSTSATNNQVNEYLLDTVAQSVPTEVSAETSDKMSMIAILTDLETQLDGHAKRNKHNAELEQENVLLKSTLSIKDESITFLQSEKEKVLSEKKELVDSYLDEIVCLKSANKVAKEML